MRQPFKFMILGMRLAVLPRGESKRRGASSDEGLPRCEGRRAQVVRVQARRELEILEGKG